MEFDKRILSDKKPLSCLDAEEAMQFTGTECYLSDFAHQFEDLDDIENSDCISTHKKGILTRVDCSGREEAFESVGRTVYKYCLPAEWVKEPEKKYRPYTLKEFAKEYSLGDKVIVRRKGGNCGIEHKLFTEYIEGDMDVCFSGFWYPLDILFNNYELYTSEGWKPFGIEV